MYIWISKNWNLLVFYFIAFILLIWFHVHGIIYYDEGYILHAAMQTANGLVPYRDFDMVYTPISFASVALFFKLFGQSVLVGRIVALLISVFSLYAIYRIWKLLQGRTLLLILGSSFFVVWGPMHINFPWPTMYGLCFTLYTLLFVLYGLLKNRKYYFWAGVFSTLIFLSKQNFGIAIPLITLGSITFLDRKYWYENFKIYSIGFLLILLVFIIYLTSTNSFIPFVQSLNVNVIQKILVEKTLDTPFLSEGSLISKIGKLFFYTSPLIISLITVGVVYKRKKEYLVVPAFIIAFYLIGIRPTTDLDHFVALLAFSGLNMLLLCNYINGIYLRFILYITIILFIGVGFYTAYLGGYYKWETPLRNDNSFDSQNRVGVYLDQSSNSLTSLLAHYVDSKTGNRENIYINYYSPMVYFLSNRDNATKYDYLNIPLSYQKEIISDLKNKKVKFVILDEVNINEKTIVNKYIKSHYHFDKRTGDFLGYYIN